MRVTEVDGAVVVDDFGDEEADDDEICQIHIGGDRNQSIKRNREIEGERGCEMKRKRLKRRRFRENERKKKKKELKRRCLLFSEFDPGLDSGQLAFSIKLLGVWRPQWNWYIRDSDS
ncbi:hypothetical protein WN943_024490 [Citrus x changshan-huyou]